MKKLFVLLAILLSLVPGTATFAKPKPETFTQYLKLHVNIQGPIPGTSAYDGHGSLHYKFYTDSIPHDIAINWDDNGEASFDVEGPACYDTFFYWWKGSKTLANYQGAVSVNCNFLRDIYDETLALTADAYGDNIINVIDLNTVHTAWGTACGNPLYNVQADFNNDCNVNIVDFNWIKNNWGRQGFPAPW